VVYLWSLLSGIAFGAAAVLQHHEARLQRADLALTLGLVRGLVAQPLWLAGTAADIGGFASEALALGSGSLIAVQALKTSGVVFAMIFGALWRGTRVRGRDSIVAILLVTAIATFLAIARPVDSASPLKIWPCLVAAAATSVLAGALIVLSRHAKPATRSMALGAASGAIWALTAALLKGSADSFGRVGAHVLISWQPWALILTSAVGLIVNQTAFQAGELVWSLPAMTVTEPLLGTTFGLMIFSERFATSSPAAFGAIVASSSVALVSAFWLARDPTH
jgi:drug/metabolite transporter (DMT)-like permease